MVNLCNNFINEKKMGEKIIMSEKDIRSINNIEKISINLQKNWFVRKKIRLSGQKKIKLIFYMKETLFNQSKNWSVGKR